MPKPWSRATRRRRVSPGLVCLIAGLAVGAVLAAAATAGEPLDIEPDALRPGLLAVYRPLGRSDPAVYRVDAKPAFYLGESSPHPRIPPGPFEVAWRGVVLLRDPGPIRFEAMLGGAARVEVDGETVLESAGAAAGATDDARVGPGRPLTRPPGYYPIQIVFQSHVRTPARLQLSWSGGSFAREPLPPWRMGHLAESVSASPDWTRGASQESGRLAAGRFGCARCHREALPAVNDPPPGPSLADAARRLGRDWLRLWLDDPSAVRVDSRMPALFAADRAGAVERWLIADYLAGTVDHAADPPPRGDHRAGRLAYLSLGCVACHFVPDQPRASQLPHERSGFEGLGDRMSAEDLAAFLGNPHGRYPDGRMPRLPLPPDTARDVAAYLLLWARPGKPPETPATAPVPPTADETRDVARRLGLSDRRPVAIATALLAEKGCVACHTGLGPVEPRGEALTRFDAGCLARDGARGRAPRFRLDDSTRQALGAYLAVAAAERHPSPFAERQARLAFLGCVRCHQRDSDRPSPLEEIGRTLGGAYLQTVPYQRTPRLTYPHQRLLRSYVTRAVRDGVSAARSAASTYRMPAFGVDAESVALALAEADGEKPVAPDPPPRLAADPTIGTQVGPTLVGSTGYGCISCHVWAGQQLTQPDPSAVGPDLTTVVGRIRPDWFDRFVEDPLRSYPGTPMPAIFPRGRHATLTAILDGDPLRQREALWSYLGQGRAAPPPKPPAPVPVAAPEPGTGILVAQVPLRLADGTAVESISMLGHEQDLLVYDLAAFSPRGLFLGGQILRSVQGRTRQFLVGGEAVGSSPLVDRPLGLETGGIEAAPSTRDFLGYDRLPDGMRLRHRLRFKSATVDVTESFRIEGEGTTRRLSRGYRATGLPRASSLIARLRPVATARLETSSRRAARRDEGGIVVLTLAADAAGGAEGFVSETLPPPRGARPWQGALIENPDPEPGSLERPGYRAVAFPRPKTIAGEDRVMPAALAVDPRDGKLLVSSLKTGELLAVDNPRGAASALRFRNYANGLFQDTFALLGEADGLKILHRRNLTNAVDTDGDGRADRFDRLVALPHGVADTYDYAYGMPRDRTGGFIISYAPHANHALTGSGSVLRVVPGQPPEEVAFGLRNPLGWAAGPEGEIFFTDNQGEWVATNKLGHVEPGRYYGYPNQAQKQHAEKPLLRAAVWVPYAWARSINGLAYDTTHGKFGPFAGQLFLAELTFGGAIVRANVEKVNGHYQGACFPFWGKGLLGPLSLAFDPRGPLYVGGITEPGWMAQPDRGALFRIDFTGDVPFEIQSIHARPRGFRLVFTRPIDPTTASAVAAFQVERFRYEYTGSYGSPELDRTRVTVESVAVAADGRSVELTTAPLVADRVYMIGAAGVRAPRGESLVYPTGAYTLNEIPAPGS